MLDITQVISEKQVRDNEAPRRGNIPERSSRVSWFKPILAINVDLILVSPSWRSKPPDQALRLPSIHGSLCSANYFYFRIEGPDYFNLSFHGRSLSSSCIRVFASLDIFYNPDVRENFLSRCVALIIIIHITNYSKIGRAHV